MPPKKPKAPPTQTSRAILVSALRKVWMWSIERRTALKRDGNTCQICGKKATTAKGREFKVDVHHLKEGDINWDRIERVLRAELFCPADELITLCKEHHKEVHAKGEI